MPHRGGELVENAFFECSRLEIEPGQGYYRAATEIVCKSPPPRIVHIFGFSSWWPEPQTEFMLEVGSLPQTGLLLKAPTLGDVTRFFSGRRCRALESIGVFIALTGAIRKELISLGIPPRKVAVIPNGVRTDWFLPTNETRRAQARQRLQLPNDGLFFGYCGRFERRKRIDMLIKTFHGLKSRPLARLILVGDTDDTFGNGFEVAEAQSTGDVIVVGPQSDMRIVYNALDAYVSLSEAEGMSNSILEAMSAGLPILASDIPGHRELVDDGVNGIRIAMDDPVAIKRLVENLVNERSTAWFEACGRRSRAKAVSQFDMRCIGDCYRNLYHELAYRTEGH
jgi:glycosyltransferase involved in cell wall biosynthesis